MFSSYGERPQKSEPPVDLEAAYANKVARAGLISAVRSTTFGVSLDHNNGLEVILYARGWKLSIGEELRDCR